MASRIIPGISLRAFWDLGESGWKAGMDENIWRLSFLVQSRVLGVVETLPPGPEEGDRYILNNDVLPYDQHIMVFDQALWVPILPEDRFVVFNTENDSLMYFNEAGNTWVSLISPEAIKEAYESNPNSNEFTDDEKAKLAGIEDGATADMTAEEIKAAYESNPNSNAFTDAEKAKLSGLSSSRFLGVYPTLGSLQSSHPAPAEGSFGYVDGGPLLDILCYIWDANSVKYVLQASAGGMETPETIKIKYESNEDTNAFTDAEKEKLALIDPDEPGPQGQSAYEVAVANGFVGTISEWLVSLIGSPGTNGTDGTDGTDGADGVDGTDGVDGKTVLYGTAAPTTEGVDGDFYIRTTTHMIYGPKAAGTWPAGTSLIGAAGTSFPAFSRSVKTANYVAVTGDFSGNKEIEMGMATANTFTVNSGLTGIEPLAISQGGAGQTTIVAGVGVTIYSAGGALKLRVQQSVATLIPIGSNVYRLAGDITT